jgi:RND family efflux transporter MFP subunit
MRIHLTVNGKPPRLHVVSKFLSLIFSMAAVAGFAGCHKSAEGNKEEPPPVPVRVAKAEQRTLQPSFEVIGIVQADPERQATLTAASSGLVEKLIVREGGRVQKGALVVQMDERKARIDLERAEATFARFIAKPRPEEVAQSRAAVDKAKASHALAETRLKKSVDLRKRNPDLVPEVQLLDDQRNEQVARAEVDTAKAQLQLLEKGPRDEQRRESKVEVEAAQLQLDFCRVTAPFAGEVVELLARVGMRADVGTPLARILDTNEVLVQARVPGNRLTGVLTALQPSDKGPKVKIRSISFPGEVFLAHGGWLNRQTEAQTSDVPIKLRVPNPKGMLRVGLTVQVELHEPAIEGIAIPDAAISVNEEGHRVVTVIRDGKAVPTKIEVSSETEPEVRAGGWVRVLKGLQVGDEVAIENGYALPKGTPVTAMPPRPSTGDSRP